jgi:hypothetical protein
MTFSPTNIQYTTTPLYGGAITVDIPQGFLDASTIRPVPDNQEVFTSPRPPLGPAVPVSIIFDICQAIVGENPDWRPEDEPNRTCSPDDEEAAGTHWDNLVDDGDKPDLCEREDNVVFENVDKREGHEYVGSVEKKDGTGILLGMLLLRLKEQEADIVVSVIIDSREDGQALGDKIRRRIRESLKIEDWRLFPTDEEINAVGMGVAPVEEDK